MPAQSAMKKAAMKTAPMKAMKAKAAPKPRASPKATAAATDDPEVCRSREFVL